MQMACISDASSECRDTRDVADDRRALGLAHPSSIRMPMHMPPWPHAYCAQLTERWPSRSGPHVVLVGLPTLSRLCVPLWETVLNRHVLDRRVLDHHLVSLMNHRKGPHLT